MTNRGGAETRNVDLVLDSGTPADGLTMDKLRFEARDLKPYGEYASESTLVEGKTYFAVHFLDDETLVPELRPLVFIGRDREPSDSGQFYFQDAESYFAGARYESATAEDGAEFHCIPSGTPAVFDPVVP